MDSFTERASRFLIEHEGYKSDIYGNSADSSVMFRRDPETNYLVYFCLRITRDEFIFEIKVSPFAYIYNRNPFQIYYNIFNFSRKEGNLDIPGFWGLNCSDANLQDKYFKEAYEYATGKIITDQVKKIKNNNISGSSYSETLNILFSREERIKLVKAFEESENNLDLPAYYSHLQDTFKSQLAEKPDCEHLYKYDYEVFLDILKTSPNKLSNKKFFSKDFDKKLNNSSEHKIKFILFANFYLASIDSKEYLKSSKYFYNFTDTIVAMCLEFIDNPEYFL